LAFGIDHGNRQGECGTKSEDSAKSLMLERPVDRGPEVVKFLGQPLTRNRLRSFLVQAASVFGKHAQVVRVTPVHVIWIARRLQPLRCVLADRLQHPLTAVHKADKALVDERLERVQVGIADLLGGIERAAATKDGQPGEQALLVPL
jgi:hypothetical protein